MISRRSSLSEAEAEMDPALARRLFEEGAFLVIFGMPQHTEFGIDNNIWQVGPRFRGVKLIPPGLHFVHYSAVCAGPPRRIAPRLGFFHNFARREVLVRKWDRTLEELSEQPVPTEEIESIRAKIKDLDCMLGAYPYNNLRQWLALVSHVTPKLASDLQPADGRVSASPILLPDVPGRTQTDRMSLTPNFNQPLCTSLQEGEARLPAMHPVPGTELRFSLVPTRCFPSGASPAEVTRHSLDRSFALDSLIESKYRGDEHAVLGELQFAFVCFWLCHVLEAFAHWKALLELLASSVLAATKRPRLYSDLVPVLYAQLQHVPEDMFVDIVASENFLTRTLHELFETLSNSPVEPTLRQRASRFKEHLSRTYGWDFDSEPDDCAPVLVELSGTHV
uniref:protein AAR2 homolog n=1 Tax=Myxine glutinosa TaxID=7769 RepID=UPI00358E3ABE